MMINNLRVSKRLHRCVQENFCMRTLEEPRTRLGQVLAVVLERATFRGIGRNICCYRIHWALIQLRNRVSEAVAWRSFLLSCQWYKSQQTIYQSRSVYRSIRWHKRKRRMLQWSKVVPVRPWCFRLRSPNWFFILHLYNAHLHKKFIIPQLIGS